MGGTSLTLIEPLEIIRSKEDIEKEKVNDRLKERNNQN